MSARRAVPWIHATHPMFKTWSWETEHFEAKITLVGKTSGYTWKVVDISGSSKDLLDLGETTSWKQAESDILELVGKAYPLKFGYGAYAGDLATTFTIKTGIKVNFAKYVGTTVIAEVFNKRNPERPQVIAGTLTVENFNIQIRTDNSQAVLLPPAFILNIRKEYDPSKVEEYKTRKTGRRVFQGEWRKGCTGSPGYVPGTVVHNPSDDFCPLHDD